MKSENPGGQAVPMHLLPDKCPISTAPARANPTRDQMRADLSWFPGCIHRKHSDHRPYYLALGLTERVPDPLWDRQEAYGLTEKGRRIRDRLNKEGA